MASYTVAGSDLFWMQLRSPIVLIVTVLSIAGLAFLVALAGKLPASVAGRIGLGPRVRRYSVHIAILIALLEVSIIVGVTYATTRPGVDYGITINGTSVTVVFYEDKSITFNVCDASFNLTSADEALELLKVRTNGVADPSTGLYAGYYKTVDGRKAYVFIEKKLSSEAIIFRLNTGEYIVVGVPGAQQAFNDLKAAAAAHCG